MHPRRPLTAAFLLAVTATFAVAAPPTDEQIDGLIADVAAAGADVKDPAAAATARRDLVLSRMDGISWSELTAPQLDRLAAKGLLRPYPEVREAVLPRLKELCSEPTVEGARCADILMACWQPPRTGDAAAQATENQKRCEALVAALQHPKMGELFKAGKGGNLFAAVPQFPMAMVKEQRLIERVEPFITTDLMPVTASALGGIFDLVSDEDFGAPPELLKRMREKIAAAAAAAATKDDPRLADEPRQAANIRKNLKNLAASCNSAHARGELIDHPAPTISFTWSSTPEPLRTWADLKGKVVLVDFWATWCGPCIAAFPKMRTLTEHYKGYPVVVLGVTSEQGFHIARSNKPESTPERIDCDGDPDKEHGLMKQFMRDMDVTWPVVFTEENVFNPDFGVRGIPHLAIIDPAGKVRFNALRPGKPEAIAEKIDALLNEFKLGAPAGSIGAAR